MNLYKGSFVKSAPVLALVISFLFFYAGCAHTRAMFGGRLQVHVEISDGANQDNPVAVDLVMAHDEKLVEALREMTAKQWFASREQIKLDYILGEGLDHWAWEWTPGQTVEPMELILKPQAKAAFVFVDFMAPGAHRFRLDPFKDIIIRIAGDEVTVESLE